MHGLPSNFAIFSLPAAIVSNGLSISKSATSIYNSSTTPASLPWNTYNYCNAAHVNAKHYFEPTGNEGAELLYLNVVTRHHKVCFLSIRGIHFGGLMFSLNKRTPDNLYPDENELNTASGWNCESFHQQSYSGGTAPVFHETLIPSWHPYLSTIWNGTCDAGQLTREGLDDAILHGQVSMGCYFI